MADIQMHPVSLERMVRAAEKVRERLLRAAAALDRIGVPYAVAGGQAIAAWVSRVDEAAVRNTHDVDLLLRRSDLDAAAKALESAGFVRRHSGGVEMFLDGALGNPRDAVHIVFAGERVRPDYPQPAPDVDSSAPVDRFQLLNLPELVEMKLTSFRDKGRTHVRDLIDVGLVDASWYVRLPDELAARLKSLIDTPDG